jgi:RimJ/RimL family protein N-acetyltransferase
VTDPSRPADAPNGGAPTEPFTCTNGREVLIRPAVPDDADALVAALDRADPGLVARRFLGAGPSEAQLRARLQALPEGGQFALLALADEGRVVGEADYAVDPERPDTAEVAVAVGTDWQNAGLATALLQRLAHVARSRGVHRLTAVYSGSNQEVADLIADAGLPTRTRIEGGTAEVELVIDSGG